MGDTRTYVARYDDLVNGREQSIDVSGVDVSMNVIALQDRELVAVTLADPGVVDTLVITRA